MFFGFLALSDDEIAGFGSDEGEADGYSEFRLSHGVGDAVETMWDADFDGGFESLFGKEVDVTHFGTTAGENNSL